jgi:hypothetical protein
VGSANEPIAIPAATDVFGDAVLPPVVAARKPFRREPRTLRPTPVRLVVAAAIAAPLAYLFDMPFTWESWVSIGGIPFPPGLFFVVGAVAAQATRGNRRLQLTIAALTAALFFAFGCPLIIAAFAPPVRYVFFLGIIGSAIALYEWSMP